MRQIVNTYESLIRILSRESGIPIIDIMNDLELVEDSAYRDPDLFRNVRHDIQSQQNLLGNDHILYSMRDKYGLGSITLGTMMKEVSIVELKKSTVDSMSSSIPPAFDYSLRATVKNAMSYHDIIRLAPKTISLCKVRLQRWIDKHKETSIVLLTNGSSMGYQSGSIPVTDIMANICAYPSDKSYPYIANYFGILNSKSDNDNFVYLQINDRFQDYCFIHHNIPDKDGKKREVYQGNSSTQVLSKRIHEALSYVAKYIPGNYTFNQRAWVNNIISKGWNKDKNILTTDMSKYSDTLDRSFVMSILRKIGIPGSVLKEMDDLYSRPVYDKVTGNIYNGTLATYQGQYGDFPMITIANLVLQEACYNLIGQQMRDGYNAAVGDDTGMVFDTDINLDKALTIVKQVYGSVGVNINELKTGKLIQGNGYGDFVKLTFDRNGIRPFLEYKAYRQQNEDQVIRDIYDNGSISMSDKHQYFTLIFGRDMADYLMNIHKINGGLRTGLITIKDVTMLANNTISLLSDIRDKKDTNELYRFLKQSQSILNDSGYNLKDTCLIKLMDPDAPIGYEDDSIIVNCLGISKVGLDRDINFIRMVGHDWNTINEENKKRLQGKSYDPILCEVYDDIDAFVQLQGRFRDKIKRMNNKHVYRDHFETSKDPKYYHKLIPKIDCMLCSNITCVDEYYEAVDIIIEGWNNSMPTIFAKGYTNDPSSKFYKVAKYWYYIDNGIRYRLYNSNSRRFPLITQQIINANPQDFLDMRSVKEVTYVFDFR